MPDLSKSDLADRIYNYYCANFDDLSYGKKLHFCTRLAHWDSDTFCLQKLEELRRETIGSTDVRTTLIELHQRYTTSEPSPGKNAAELRYPFFMKYPELRAINVLLFRTLVYMKSYGIDCRPIIDELYPDNAIGLFLDKLFLDDEAVAVLSTHAINAQYLYRRLVQENDSVGTANSAGFDPVDIYRLGQQAYDLSDKTHLKLYIYLYTHCIIGESIFYTRHIPEHLRSQYLQMINSLEKVIDENFEDINLDNKCEYLACCQIMGVSSPLRGRIEGECAQSLSPEGDFLIDTINRNPQTDCSDFNKSEHRNVLYIMANLPYRVSAP